MPDPVAPNESQGVSTWDEVRRLADELHLEIHLAGMNARDRWHSLEPRLVAFEQRMKDAGQRASRAVSEELDALWAALRGLREEVASGN